MGSTDAKPIPYKNAAFRAYLPIFDADGDLVSAATGLDSEVSKDGGAFADCTNEATEIGTSGMYYLDLTAAEMNADAVVIVVKSTSGKTSPIVLYPEETGDIRVHMTSLADGVLTAAKFAAGALDSVWSTATRTLTAFGFNVTIGTNNDKTGYSLSSAGVQAIWDALTSALTTANSIGKLLVDNVNATISSRLASSSYTAPDNAGIASLNSKLTTPRANNLDNLDAAVSTRSTLTTPQVNTEVNAALAAVRLDELLAASLASAPAVGSLFGDLTEDALGVQRFTANALEQAPSGGGGGTADWTTGEREQIRHRLGIDGTATAPATGVPSLATQSSVDTVDTNVDTVKAKTDQLAFTGGDVNATLAGEQVVVATNNDKAGYSLSAAGIQAIWDSLTSAFLTVGSIGKHLVDRLDATVGSRLAGASYTAPDNAGITSLNNKLTTQRATNLDNLDAIVSSRLAEASYVAPDNAGIDTLELRLTDQRAANLDNLDQLADLSNLANLDVAVSTRLAAASYTAPANASITAVEQRLTAERATKLDNLDATVSSRSSHSVADIWNALTSSMMVAGSAGRAVRDFLDATISSRLPSASYTAPDNAGITSLNSKVTTARAAKLDNLDAQVSTRLAASGYTAPDNTTISTLAARLGAFAGTGANTVLGVLRAIMRSDATLPTDVGGTFNPATDALEAIRNEGDTSWADASTPQAIADAVWDALMADHVDADTLGAAISFLYDKVQRVGGVKFVTPIDPMTLKLTLIQGKDYAAGDALEWENERYDLTGATVTFNMWHAETREVVITGAGAVEQASNPARVRVELTNADTATLLAGERYEYDVDVTLQNGNKVAFVAISPVKVIADVG